jgi:hypothetical protein
LIPLLTEEPELAIASDGDELDDQRESTGSGGCDPPFKGESQRKLTGGC